jgi:GT2 family glycosyltransferase
MTPAPSDSPDAKETDNGRSRDEKNRVAAIVVNWNQSTEALGCINSLLGGPLRPALVVVVDNGSSAEQRNILRNGCKGLLAVEIVELSWNSGFTGGVNAGFRHLLASAIEHDWILLLNNDARVTPSALQTLVRFGLEYSAAILSPMIMDSEGSLELFRPRAWPAELFGLHRPIARDYNVAAVPRVDGCAMLIRTDIALRRSQLTGALLDERFFLYWEDVDFCMQVRSWGETALHVREAIVTHKVALSSGGTMNPTGVYYQTRNRVLIAKKWLPFWCRALFLIVYPFTRMANIIRRLAHRETDPHVREVLLGLFHGYLSRFGPRTGRWPARLGRIGHASSLDRESSVASR